MQKRASPPNTPDIKREGFHPMSPHNKSIPRAVLAALLTMMLPSHAWPTLSKARSCPIWLRSNWRASCPKKLEGQVILSISGRRGAVRGKSSFPAMEELTKKIRGPGSDDRCRQRRQKTREHAAISKIRKGLFHVVRDAQQKLVAAATSTAMRRPSSSTARAKSAFIHTGFNGTKPRVNT